MWLFEEQFNMNLMSSDEDFQADHLDWDDGVVHVLDDINREVHLQEWLFQKMAGSWCSASRLLLGQRKLLRLSK